ncbi:MAG TPA: hypothetical protein VFB36_16840 [Nevskiaceae bacterium]|nr:hypothetical protein [Nevskiaceae bacterium]
MIKRCTVAALAACLTSATAMADPMLANDLTPNLTLRLQFGARSEQSTHVTALFDVRSLRFQRDPELVRAALDSGSSADLTAAAGVPLVKVFELGASRRGVDVANVLGRDMLVDSQRLNETGEMRWWQHKWIWWTAGSVVAAGAALAAMGAHMMDDLGSQVGNGDSNNNGGGSTNCNVISGSNIPPHQGDPPPSVLDCSSP